MARTFVEINSGDIILVSRGDSIYKAKVLFVCPKIYQGDPWDNELVVKPIFFSFLRKMRKIENGNVISIIESAEDRKYREVLNEQRSSK